MKTELTVLVVAMALTSGCGEEQKKKRHNDDAGEGGEDAGPGTSGGSAGTAPGAGSPATGGSANNAGASGSTPLPSGGSAGTVANSGGNSASGGDPGEPSGGSNVGSGGTDATGGTSSEAGSSNAGTSSGNGGSGASAGSGGDGASAGTSSDPCGCSASEACDQNGTCVDRLAIDDFGACDDQIPEIEGRSGLWGDFGSTALTYSTAFGDPGAAWDDHSCAAWMDGGGTTATSSDYAGLFVMLNADGTEGGGPYSLSGYTGIRIVIESEHQLVLQVRTVGDGYFGIVLTPDAYPVTTYDIPFSYMSVLDHSVLASFDLTRVTQIQVTVVPTAITAFAFAIHYVGLY